MDPPNHTRPGCKLMMAIAEDFAKTSSSNQAEAISVMWCGVMVLGGVLDMAFFVVGCSLFEFSNLNFYHILLGVG